jgi:hypothetical protein
MPVLIALALAAAITADPDLPIAGAWHAVPSPDALGPERLTISRHSITFGRDGEAVRSWKATTTSVSITTRSGLTYVFRRDARDRICLMASVRTARQSIALGATPLRCFVAAKDAD